MSGVRVLVGTRKGAFILTSDAGRKKWDISGPHFAGWEIYHLKGSPVDPDRVYASQTSGWFGQVIQLSNDGGKTWVAGGNKFVYDGVPGTHQWYDGTQHPWEFKRIWYLEPSLTDPDTVYAGGKTPVCSARAMAGRRGRSCPGCGMLKEISGSRARVGCACIPFFRTPAIPSGCLSPSRRRARSAPMTAARPGGQRLAVCGQITSSQTRTRMWATASTT